MLPIHIENRTGRLGLIYELLITTETLTKHITIIKVNSMINTDSYSKLLSNKSQLPQRNCTYDSTH